MKGDKGLLKKALYQDQARLMESIKNETDASKKNMLSEALNLINNYILICVNRNKF